MSESVETLKTRLTQGTLDAIEETFPNSTLRQGVSVELLALWDRNPTNKERIEIAERHGCSNSNVGKIIDKLGEAELFTSDLGSVPLFTAKKRSEMRGELDVSTPVHVRSETHLHLPMEDADEDEEYPEVDEEGESDAPLVRLTPNPSHIVTPSEAGGEPIIPLGSLRDVEKRVSEQDSRVASIERKVEAGFASIENLLRSLKQPQSNPVQVPMPAVKINPLTVNPPEEAEEVEQEPVRRGGNPREEETEDDADFGPFAGMSKKELLDMAMNDPDGIHAMVRGYTRGERTIMAAPETMRWMGVMLSTYTQSAFERSLSDGYEGTLSDFLNDCVFQYFADRGKVLQWADLPQPGRMPYPQRRLG